MGTETEFGISVSGQPNANPMLASSQIVNAYASATWRGPGEPGGISRRRAQLRDARGFDLGRKPWQTRACSPTRTSDLRT